MTTRCDLYTSQRSPLNGMEGRPLCRSTALVPPMFIQRSEGKIVGNGDYSSVTDRYSPFHCALFAHGGCFLAFAGAQVIQLRPAGAAFFFHFDLGDAGRMQREHALDSFTVGNPADGKGFVEATPFSANDDAGENLNAFFVAFHHSSMDADGVAHAKCRQFSFELVFLDGVDDAIHGSSLLRALNLRGCGLNASVPSRANSPVRHGLRDPAAQTLR